MNETLDPKRAAAALMEALAAAFADMAFIDVGPIGSEARPRGGGSRPRDEGAGAKIRAAIDVLRPLSCRIEIECPATLKARIEETLFMGESGKEEDSLLELLNVAAGLFLSAYFGPGTDIKLELPQYLFLSEGSEGDVLAEVEADAEGALLRAVLRTIRYRY
jgi:hypothetical protein